MDRRAAWVLGILFGVLFLGLFAFLALLYVAVRSDGPALASGGPRVGVVEVTGAIGDSKQILEDLEAFERASHIQAVVVRVDSPGGAVGPSQEIHEAILALRKKKRVVVSLGSVAASGGYYVAAAGEKIFANPGTLTGSIGVIFQMPNVEGLMRWAGVEMRVITAGKLKDSGSPFREMTAEERAYFEGVLADVHGQFVAAVAAGRNLEVAAVEPYADGRVFTGRQAQEWGLVDELGGLEVAVAAVAELAGLRGEPRIEYPRRRRGLLEELVGEDVGAIAGGARALVERAGASGLQYRMPFAEL